MNEEKGVCEFEEKELPDGICQDCRVNDGLTFDKEKNECVCHRGLVLKDDACVPCPAGFMLGNEGECAPCPWKRYKRKGYRDCLNCAEASEETQDVRCVKCEAGEISTGGRHGYCSKCGAGSVPNADRSGCVPKRR